MNQKIWLVSGASRGIGKSIAKKALSAGDIVAAGTRKLSDVTDLASEFPETCFPILLDVNSSESISKAVHDVIEKYGTIHVLVNNAGYGLQGMIEEVSLPQVRMQMQTNFFGLLELTQQVLPFMRKQMDGFIVNISSIAGLRGSAGFGIYNASKFAVEGLTEALAQEVRSFGIKVCAVEPGPYRTDWAGDSLDRSEAMKDLEEASPYAALNRKFKTLLDERNGKQPGDPDQIAEVLVQYSKEKTVPLHLLFGDFAVQIWNERKNTNNDPDFLTEFLHDKWKI